MKTKNAKFVGKSALVISFLAIASAVQGQTWTGGGGANNTWTNSANWGSVPANPTANTIFFNSTAATHGSNVNSPWGVGQLKFDPNTGDTVNLTGSDLTVSNAVPVVLAPSNGNGSATIANNIISTIATTELTLNNASNNAAAVLTLNGSLQLSSTTTLLKTFNHPNQVIVINGQIIDGGGNATLRLVSGNMSLTNAANNFGGQVTIGADAGNATLTVSSISNSGVASAIGTGSVIQFNSGIGANLTESLVVNSASGGATNRALDIRPSDAAVATTARLVSNVAGQTVTFSGAASKGAGTGTANLAFDGAGNGVFSGTIANSVANLSKAGGGTWTISGAAKDYTGTTTVSDGTLLVNTTLNSTGAVSVAAGATLGGNGTLGGATTISGILAPGNSIGTLTVNNDVTWNGNNAWKFELGTGAASLAAANASTDSDLLNVTGTNDFLKGTGTTFGFDFQGTGTSGWYKLVDWDNSTTFVVGDFGTPTNLASGLSGSYVLDGSTSALYLNVIPEPSSILLLLGGLGSLALLRRRRV